MSGRGGGAAAPPRPLIVATRKKERVMKKKSLLRACAGVRLERIETTRSKRREVWFRLTGIGPVAARIYTDKAAAKRAYAWGVAAQLQARRTRPAWLVVR